MDRERSVSLIISFLLPPKGDVWTDAGEGPVFVNYGRIEDFEKLASLGVSVKGKIAIMKYGGIYRGNKVSQATLGN